MYLESPGGGAPRTTKSSSGEGKDKTDETEDDKAGSEGGEKRPPSNTGDSVRIKCRELLCTALKVSGGFVVITTTKWKPWNVLGFLISAI